ncbi:MAG: Uncharacterized protein G01um10143_55 [Parcubacteria group bacterium Gr01-1014_3]|nr:MAG: Uncharacterized protein G01um10143_55 [Parcubacteria group bacterium Gr01-1014_3]
MNLKKYVLRGLLDAVGVVAYVSGLAWLMFNAKTIFDNKEPDTFLAPTLFLLAFVISASITGFLVLGKPLQLYLAGLKKEALAMLFITIGGLAMFLVLIAAIVILK